MLISINGLTWYWTTIVFAVLAYRLFAGFKKEGNIYLGRFSVFFALLVLMAFLFASTWLVSDPLLIKLFVFFGHIIMWAAFLVIADFFWLLKLKRFFSKWVLLIPILGAAGFELYLEWICHQLPEVVKLNNYFSVVQFNFCFSAFWAEAVLLWLISIPTAIVFLKESGKMEKRLKARAIGLGLSFIMVSVAGVLTIIYQPLFLLVIENIIVALGALLVLVIAFLI